MKLLKSNLLYLAILSFVFISSCTIAMGTNRDNAKAQEFQKTIVSDKYPMVPVLGEHVSTFPVFSSQAVLAQDLNSGVTLYEKNPDQAVLPASTTKIVTGLVAMDYFNLDTIITVSGVSVAGQKMGLIEGETITIKDLLYGLLVYSANDAAEVLASNYCPEEILSCGRDAFVVAMNQKAKELGLTNTKFINPSGLDGTLHFSTARDLVKVSTEAMKNPLFAEIVNTVETSVFSTDRRLEHKLTNINELLGKVEGVQGVKTGWTEAARENLVTYINRGDKRVMITLLGSQARFAETEELIKWIFENYEWKDVVYSSLRNRNAE